MNPIDNPEGWEVMIVGDRRSVGVVKIVGHDRNWDWQVNGAKGQDGATSQNNGRVIGEFDALHSFLAEEREEWLAYQRHLEGMVNGPTTQAWPVYHPDLEAQHFTDAAVKTIGGILYDENGGASCLVKFIEYKPKKPRPVKKTSAKPGSATSTPNDPAPKADPNAAAKAELASLLEEAKRT